MAISFKAHSLTSLMKAAFLNYVYSSSCILVLNITTVPQEIIVLVDSIVVLWLWLNRHYLRLNSEILHRASFIQQCFCLIRGGNYALECSCFDRSSWALMISTCSVDSKRGTGIFWAMTCVEWLQICRVYVWSINLNPNILVPTALKSHICMHIYKL